MAGTHRPDVTAIPLGRPSPGASSNQPERLGQRIRPCGALTRRVSLLFGFAPGGACHAADVAACAVRSYRTLSPLPSCLMAVRPQSGGLLSVALSLGSPPPDVIRRRIRMEPGLSSVFWTAAVRPTGGGRHMGPRRGGSSTNTTFQAGGGEPMGLLVH